jgi:hypothetical protein
MDDNEKGLSQAEIDALLTEGGGEEVANETEEAKPSKASRAKVSRAEVVRLAGHDDDEEEADDLFVEPEPKKAAPTRKVKGSQPSRPAVSEDEDDLFVEAEPKKAAPTVPKKGRKTNSVVSAKRLLADEEEESGVEDQLTDVLQRLHRVESVWEKVNKLPIEASGLELEEVFERIERVEATLETLGALGEEERAGEVKDLLTRLDKIERIVGPKPLQKEDVRKIKVDLAKLSRQIEAVSANLKDTPAYGLHKHFVCRSCGSEGHVALIIRCTQCGKEGWQGWWPE